jgi:DeoR/GlpR family transcriptional regulator of sugar metabolism
VVADHTKWGVIGVSSIARLPQADTLITDRALDAEARDHLAAEVCHLVVVDADITTPAPLHAARGRGMGVAS